uniref:Putative secreted protein n=1 Tax=Anopheles marajoara TaxID=58244 RepID=A0A2M4C7U6_9DIPT
MVVLVVLLLVPNEMESPPLFSCSAARSHVMLLATGFWAGRWASINHVQRKGTEREACAWTLLYTQLHRSSQPFFANFSSETIATKQNIPSGAFAVVDSTCRHSASSSSAIKGGKM